jgi:hypothetical protein
MKKHPSKEIQQAIDYAVDKGWRFIETGNSAHAYCRLYCPNQTRDGCKISVWSTPRSVDNHAKQIIRTVDKCDH